MTPLSQSRDKKDKMSGPNGDFVDPTAALSREEDYAALDFILDQINFCLDHLEEKNDHLNAQLRDLLESNRQARRDFQQQFLHGGGNGAQEAGM